MTPTRCGSMRCRTRGIDATRRADTCFLFWFLVFPFLPSSSYASVSFLFSFTGLLIFVARSFEHQGSNDVIVIFPIHSQASDDAIDVAQYCMTAYRQLSSVTIEPRI